MIKKILTYIIVFLAVILIGCSDLTELKPGDGLSPEGTVEISLGIPAQISVASRVDEIEVDPEYQVDYVDVFIYPNGEASTAAAQHVKASLAGSGTADSKLEQITPTQLKLTFKLDKALRSNTGLQFYVLANSPVTFTGTESVNALTITEVENLVNVDGRLAMCGSGSYTDVVEKSPVKLYRNAAKATVSSVVPNADTDDADFYPFEIFGNASKSPLLAGKLADNSAPEAVASYPENINAPTKVYFHATSNSVADDGIGGKLFVITKAAFNGADYYYRLDFAKKDEETGALTYIKTYPNHWYQFVITEVTAAGYATPAEAALHPENGVKYQIHDHCTESFNMASDGYRELGVSHTIEYQNGEGEPAENDRYLYIKLFSPIESELPATTEAVSNLVTIAEPDWLELSAPELVTDENVTGGDGIDIDPNDKGVVYRMKLSFLPTTEIGTLYNTITVEWMGLKREVSVVWLREFNGAEVSTASLTMTYIGEPDKIDDYWTFLSSTDDPENLAYPSGNLWGIQPELCNEKVRNQGFHFPVMYGTGSTLATYSYKLDFNKEDKLLRSNVTKVEVSSTDSNVKADELTGGDYYSFTITRSNADKYDYKVGDIKFTFTFADGSKDAYSFKTYHTGFFHKENVALSDYQLDGPHDYVNYFYYEVLPVIVDGTKRYILDRNLSAKSAQTYVRDADGSTVVGNPEAAGGYYVIARQTALYQDPTLVAGITPPGYAVPDKAVWDAIRLSTAFHSEAEGSYYQAYYDTGSPLTGYIYFPKAMFYRIDNGGITGESRSGYYWTSTPATGTEKDEIGRWLQMFVLTGGSTTFNSAYVLNQSDQWNLAYANSLRCVNASDQESTVYRTHFNVSGATHVYLYTVEDGIPTSTTAWPGHAIGNYATMDPANDNWFGFTYSSTQFQPANLYVIFNFVDAAGIIHTYSLDAEGRTIKTTSLNPKEITGWKVEGGTYPGIKAPGDYTIDGRVLHPVEETALGNWWRCGGSDTDTDKETTDPPYVYNYYTDISQRATVRR